MANRAHSNCKEKHITVKSMRSVNFGIFNLFLDLKNNSITIILKMLLKIISMNYDLMKEGEKEFEHT